MIEGNLAPVRRSPEDADPRPPPRICVFQNIIAPYRIPLFREMDALLGGRLLVVYATRTEARRAWAVPEELTFRHVVLPAERSAFRRASALARMIRRGGFEVVVSGGGIFMPEAHVVANEARRAGASVGFFWESHLASGRPHHLLRRSFHRWVLSHFDFVLVPGWASWDHCVAAGFPPRRAICVPNSVDVWGWAALAENSRDRREDIRRELGLRSRVVTYVGRFSPEKGVDRLVTAFRASRDPDRSLLLVGEGPEEATLRALAGADRRVVITGFREGLALADAYVAADVHVLPSRAECWGLVVNEAMACGVPSIVTDRVGAREMVLDGHTGFVVPAGSDAALARAIERATAEQAACRAMGENAQRLVMAGYSPRRQAERFVAALQAAAALHRPSGAHTFRRCP